MFILLQKQTIYAYTLYKINQHELYKNNCLHESKSAGAQDTRQDTLR